MMKNNLKYQKTERAIKQAVIKLINLEGLSKVTVQQISAYANINRTTFYRHYLDKPDLTAKYRVHMIESLQEIIDQELIATNPQQNPGNPATLFPLFQQIIDFVAADWEFNRAWLGSHGDQETISKVVSLIDHSLKKKLGQVQEQYDLHPTIPMAFAQELIVSQLWSIVKIWLRQVHPLSKDEIIDILIKTRYSSPFELTGVSNIKFNG